MFSYKIHTTLTQESQMFPLNPIWKCVNIGWKLCEFWLKIFIKSYAFIKSKIYCGNAFWGMAIRNWFILSLAKNTMVSKSYRMHFVNNLFICIFLFLCIGGSSLWSSVHPLFWPSANSNLKWLYSSKRSSCWPRGGVQWQREDAFSGQNLWWVWCCVQ